MDYDPSEIQPSLVADISGGLSLAFDIDSRPLTPPSTMPKDHPAYKQWEVATSHWLGELSDDEFISQTCAIFAAQHPDVWLPSLS